ncbi:MAG: UDP-N-acetylglucosamine 2-epimerase [Rhodospirillales bacterium]|nr:UDP-N-acetylglucosamine 2-epimerase [Rhodospirillales bacterium]
MRRIAVVTTSRADYGIYRPLLLRLQANPNIELQLVVGGMHLKAKFGNTLDEILTDGINSAAKVDMLSDDDSALGMALAMGIGTQEFAKAFNDLKPDILVVLGDRYEMYSAVVAAQPFAIPIAHLHGGELTLGALDDNFRHSITKMSHLHFAATEVYANRIKQLGEESWRVITSGGLALDNLLTMDLMDAKSLSASIDIPLEPAPLLVTYHPTTRHDLSVEVQINGLLRVLNDIETPILFTAPNADEGGEVIRRLIEQFVTGRDNAKLVENLGTLRYFSLMSFGAAMVGNSSSGVTEAASFALPVVNIGTRQEGRLRPANIIDVNEDAKSIKEGITKALSPEFKDSLKGLKNPYQNENGAAAMIHQTLATIEINQTLVKKRFIDL